MKKRLVRPKFSVCFIGRNEEKVLQRALDSLKEFKDRGGEICFLDTGSSDNTVKIAENFGCVTKKVGEKFLTTITKEQADAVNSLFMEKGEENILKEGEKLFDFASARNYCADNLSTNDMVAWLDCDEIYTALDIDAINQYIEKGFEQFEYEFIFSHDHLNRPLLQFVQSKFYNKTKMRWTGIVHEVITGAGKLIYLPENVLKNEHWQNHETNRSGYLRGLAFDCYQNQNKDRQSHYFARELMWNNRPKSAIKEFKRHLTISHWNTERGQSMIYIGDCLRKIGKGYEQKAVDWYHASFKEEPRRREPLIRLAEYYYFKKDFHRVICYCKMALEIAWSGFYANNKYHYEHIPHELLAEGYWVMGHKEKAKEHFTKALEYMPTSSKLLHEYRFHYDLPKISFVIPTLGREEGLQRCLNSIKALNYPQNLIETIVIEDKPRKGVPRRVNEGYERSSGEYIVYGSNDCEFTPDSLITAVIEMNKNNKALLAFNTGYIGYDQGNICEHFIIKKDFVKKELNGEIFDTDFNHIGVDNLLWAKCREKGQEYRSRNAIVLHHHFSTEQGVAFDETYKLGWNNEKGEKDRELLKQKLEKLYNNL